jgi:uncharacterized hydrophobic protein (TIGR00271 family)
MFRRWFKDFLDLEVNTDVPRTVKTLSDGVTLRGYNIWILICSVILASIGLDVNSTAVIIGAMLISPLMSPILGIGLSIGMHDKELFIRSFKNLSVATVISLFVSTLYFTITPFGDITSELLSRTHPTFLDVMVAFFGGIAGIISSSRSQVTNAIPGVAIATALMPPLCTAGYCLASGHWDFFLGAFYLFFINALFISLSTYLIVKYLKFPVKEYINKALQRRYTQWSWVLVTLALIPSIYFLVTVYRDSRDKKVIESVVINELEKDGNEVLKWELEKQDSASLVNIYYSGLQLPETKIRAMEETCKNNGIHACRINALRVNLTKEEITGLTTNAANDMMNQWQIKMLEKKRDDSMVRLDKTTEALKVLKEIKVAFNYIDSVQLTQTIHFTDTMTQDTVYNLWYWSQKAIKKDEAIALSGFLKLRMGFDTVALNGVILKNRK